MAVWLTQNHRVKEIGRVRLDQKLSQDDIVGLWQWKGCVGDWDVGVRVGG